MDDPHAFQNTSTERSWQVDESVRIQVRLAGWSKPEVRVNTREVQTEISRLGAFAWDVTWRLPDGRSCLMSFRRQLGSGPTFDLRVGDQLLVDPDRQELACPACGHLTEPAHRVCPECGARQPNGEQRWRERTILDISRCILLFAGWMLTFGLLSFMSTRARIGSALANLQRASVQPSAAIRGSIATLRTQLGWAPWSTLLQYLVCALLMLLLARWARRAPFPAISSAGVMWIALFAVIDLNAPQFHVLPLVLQLLIVWPTWRAAKLAFQLRASPAAHAPPGSDT